MVAKKQTLGIMLLHAFSRKVGPRPPYFFQGGGGGAFEIRGGGHFFLSVD